ncbi:MAG: hypothetical protein ACRD0K_05385 [Egibacteraceae bacterium]
MYVDVRPTERLRGSQSIDLAASLGPVIAALANDSVDLARVRVVCDWVQYRNNFRDAVDVRPIMGPAFGGPATEEGLFLFSMSNVYDNLPSDEVARIRGRAPMSKP